MTRAEANRLLDLVRAGGTVTESEILFALWITGDLLAGAAMHDMPHMQTLDTEKSRGNGKTQICALRNGLPGALCPVGFLGAGQL